MLTEEDKKNILNLVLSVISDITDKKYQERIWIRREGPEIDDFIEACCVFFSDCDPMLEKYRDFRITDSQYKILKNFRDRFKTFSNKYDFAEEFIDTPEWDEIREMAKEVLKAFNYKKIN